MTDLTPLMIGLKGPRPDKGAVALLRRTGAVSVLLLGRNIESPAQVRRLISELEQRLGRRLIFAIDHEGGWVLRFESGVRAFPGNAALGKTGDPSLAAKVGGQMGRDLGSLGIGLNLAPVLDVLGPAYNPGIHIRSFGQDPGLVSEMGRAFICGQQGHRVAACAKHFPGKGAARKDAHLTLPLIPASRLDMRRIHLSPFRSAIRAGTACVMSSHAVFPALDPSRKPATFSRKIITDLLRRRLGFTGVAISDDLCMGAVTESWTVPEAALEAFLAGHDLLIVAHAPEAMVETADMLRCAAADGRISAERWAESMRRIETLSRRFDPKPGPMPKAQDTLALDIARRAVEVRQGALLVPLDLRNKCLRALWPDFREVKDRFTFEGGPEAPFKRLKARLSRWPARIDFKLTPVASDKSLPAIEADIILFFCFEALRFPGQKRALAALQDSAPRKLAVCLLRNPWDIDLLKPEVTAVHAYGYRDCQIKAILEVLYK
ncbi:MAG: glycoside hydrolase family 3 protein [Elusimicrobia bacterium]|nr:glycoside hydrolase family 3 protein [Elusimicrobiota bacterium]